MNQIVVAVLTFRRPKGLATLVQSLLEQLRTVGPDDHARLVVIDNDPDGSAAEVLSALIAQDSSAPVRYVHEPTPGIAAARNRALAEASADDVLVFIDDDETPTPAWLFSLLGTWRVTGAGAVVGPVIKKFEAPVDPWIVAGGYFQRPRYATGTELPAAATNNLLLDLERVRAAGLRFDDRFGLSGGSDTLFTRQFAAYGARIVWCDEAEVTDPVATARMTRDWVKRRALRIGNSESRVALRLRTTGPLLPVRVRLAVGGSVRLLYGAGRYVRGVVTGSISHRATGVRFIYRGAGMASGAFGYVYVEYRRATPRPPWPGRR